MGFHAVPRSYSLPPIGVSLGVALLFFAGTWNLYGVDVDAFLLPWFAHIRAAGPVQAFATPFSNYTPPYLYLLAAISPAASILPAPILIKLLSFGGHLLLASAVRRLLATLGHAQPGRAAALVALAPTLFVSPAVLVQCDAFWAAAIICAMASAIERRHGAMFAWCGLAVAFKLQAAFIGPFFLALALSRRVPFPLWLLAPAAACAAMLPAWIAGWPAADLLTIYLRQTAWEEALALNAPNVWMIAQTLTPSLPRQWGAVATIAAAAAGLGYVLHFAKRLEKFDGARVLLAACLCALIVPGLLPRMHERYFFLADVLALSIVLLRPAEWRLGVFTQLGSGLAILAYMSGASELAGLGGVAMIWATWSVARAVMGTREPSSRPKPVAVAV